MGDVNKMVVYQAENGVTVWATQKQLAQVFGVDVYPILEEK